MKFIYTYIKNPTIAILFFWLFHVILTWPGILTPDSQTQYSIALSGIYSDHHPALMSFVWRYLDKVFPGSGLMLLLHLSLLYGSVFFLIKSFNNYKFNFLFLLLPFIPQVFIYSRMIWKDVGFAFSYLFCACFLTYLTSTKQQPTISQISTLLIILFYGTAVKFQAIYCLPVILIWLSYAILNYTLDYKKFFIIFIGIIISFFTTLNYVNDLLVPKAQKNHSWQYVKIYDLAAISTALHSPTVFPKFTINNNFTMEKLINTFNHKSVDNIVLVENAILRVGVNKQERHELQITWFKEITKHPVIYLKHRIFNISYALLSIPGFDYVIKILNKISSDHNVIYKILYFITRTIGYLTMAHITNVTISCGYFILGLIALRTTWTAVPLLFLNVISLTMLITLFFFSMAGTPRYTYIIVCMTNASHVIAYLCLKSLRQQNYRIFGN